MNPSTAADQEEAPQQLPTSTLVPAPPAAEATGEPVQPPAVPEHLVVGRTVWFNITEDNQMIPEDQSNVLSSLQLTPAAAQPLTRLQRQAILQQQQLVNFHLGEDIRDSKRQEQDALWAQAIADGRSHWSHREFAIQYADRFLAAMDDFYTIHFLVVGMYDPHVKCWYKLNEELLTHIVDYAFPGLGSLVRYISAIQQDNIYLKKLYNPHSANNKPTQQSQGVDAVWSMLPYRQQQAFRLCLRKRPLLEFELRVGSYDVTKVFSPHMMYLHEGKLARSGRLLSMTHHVSAFDYLFHEHNANDDVCRESVLPLLLWALQGHASTLLCFGQTGTGKTYTLYAALHFLAQKLLGYHVKLMFYEIHGNKCYDLLHQRQVIHLRFDGEETLHVRNAKVVEFAPLLQVSDLLAALEEGLALRSSLATERNPISSRSHAVCSLEIHGLQTGSASSSASASAASTVFDGVGKMTLVDLAGSERNYETTSMSAKEHKESADINLALMALKDCFRAYHQSVELGGGGGGESGKARKNMRIPYRASTLTKVLKECFLSSAKEHHTTIIATISPTPTDLQHSINTMNHVLLMSSSLANYVQQINVEVPKTADSALSCIPITQWTEAQVVAWVATVDRGKFSHLVLPPGLDGKGLLSLQVSQFAQLFEAQARVSRQEQEGNAWVISIEETRRLNSISMALFRAIRRQELLYSTASTDRF